MIVREHPTYSWLSRSSTWLSKTAWRTTGIHCYFLLLQTLAIRQQPTVSIELRRSSVGIACTIALAVTEKHFNQLFREQGDSMTTLSQLCTEVGKILSTESAADPDTPLGQLGIDSLNVVELILVCQQIYADIGNYEEYKWDENSTLREIDEHMQSCRV